VSDSNGLLKIYCGLEMIRLAQDRVQLWTLMKVTKAPLFNEVGTFLGPRTIIRFQRTPLHGT
jgi:hypothetical protein